MKIFVWAIALICSSAGAAERFASVEGKAEIKVSPDIIRVDFNVSRTHKTDPSVAKNQVDEICANTIRSLIQLGIAENEISSSSLSLEQKQRYDDNNNATPIGYMVSRNVGIVLRDVAQYNQVIQALVDSGVSSILNITPDVSNLEAQKRAALAKAVADGRERAEFLAQELGSKVTRIHQIGKPFSDKPFDLDEIVVTAEKRSVGGVPYQFQPGPVSITASIQLEFEIE